MHAVTGWEDANKKRASSCLLVSVLIVAGPPQVRSGL